MIQTIKKSFSPSHLKNMEGRSKDFSSNINNFVDCGEDIKLKNIMEELKEEKSVVEPTPIDYYTVNNVKQKIKEEINESDEEQVVKDSNLASDHFVDYDKYVQVQMNLTK